MTHPNTSKFMYMVYLSSYIEACVSAGIFLSSIQFNLIVKGLKDIFMQNNFCHFGRFGNVPFDQYNSSKHFQLFLALLGNFCNIFTLPLPKEYCPKATNYS